MKTVQTKMKQKYTADSTGTWLAAKKNNIAGVAEKLDTASIGLLAKI